MRFIVRIPELDSALYGGAGQAARRELLRAVHELELSGKMVEGGFLADDRGGVLLLESSSFSQLEGFLGRLFNPSYFTVEIHPLLPFNKLADLLEKLEIAEGPKPEAPRKPRPEKSLQPTTA